MIGKIYKKQHGMGDTDIVNGIIEQYKASTSTISANSFVEFVSSKGASATTIYTYSTAYNYEYFGAIGAIALDSSRVFLVYKTASSSNLSCRICTISGTSINIGTGSSLSNTSFAEYTISVVLLSSNKVCITFGNKSIICNVSGTTITVAGGAVTVGSSIWGTSVRLNENKILYLSTEASSLIGKVLTISSDAITVGTSVVLISGSYSYYGVSATLIDENKVFVTHSDASDNTKINALVIAIGDNDTITVGQDLFISDGKADSGNTAQTSTVRVENNKVLIAYCGTESEHYYRLKGIVCTISGTTITKGTGTTITPSSESYDGYRCRAIKSNSNSIFITHYSGSSYKYLNSLVCGVSGYSIVIKKKDSNLITIADTSLSSPCLLTSGHIFVPDSGKSVICGLVILNEIKESETKIDGITKEEITTSTAGDVWVLNQ